MLIDELVNSLIPLNATQLTDILSDNCLYINHEQRALINKVKIINSLTSFINSMSLTKINILNKVKDSEDTYLVSLGLVSSNSITYSAMVVRTSNNKISYIKHFLAR